MEAGCPMPGAAARLSSHPGDGWTAPDISHECVFSEACAPSPTVVHSVHLTIVALSREYETSVRLSDLLLPTEGRSPPVPPPK
jgi:hypothetical protein